MKADRLYRVARVRLVEEEEVASKHTARDLRRRLGRGMERWFAAQSTALAQLEKLLHSDLTLGALCDVFGFALPLDAEIKQQLLEEMVVGRRVRLLLNHLEIPDPGEPPTPARKFPPEFSAN